MVEVLSTIAALCLLPNGTGFSTADEIEKRQLKCQQYYAECLMGVKYWEIAPGKVLLDCVLERKAD